jgi:acyl carrier protein
MATDYQKLKEFIIKTLNLDDIQPEDIGDDEPLIESGLELDSLDALELVLALEKCYGIKIETSEEAKIALESVSSLATFLEEPK